MALAGRYCQTLRAATGLIQPGQLVTVYATGTLNKATLYRNAAGTVAQDNPVTSDQPTGQVDFYAAAGFYDLYVGGSLIAEGVQVQPGFTGAPVEIEGTRDDPESALAALLTGLASLGLIIDSTTDA